MRRSAFSLGGGLALAGLMLGCDGQDAGKDEAAAGSAVAPSVGGVAGSGGVTASAGSMSSASAPSSGGTPTSGGASTSGGSGTAGGLGGSAGASASGGDGGGAGNVGGAAGSAGAGTGGSGGAVDPALLPSITLHLAGDSTVMTYEAGSAQEGWGQELRQHFNVKLTINNQAQGGASVETFYGGRWKSIVSALHAGDCVMAAFGANDSGTVAGRHVEPPAFQSRFGVMADEVQAKQATFIVVTPSALQQWVNGKETNTRLEPYVSVLHTLAESKYLPLVDLNARSLELLNRVGQDAAQAIYIDGDKAHFTKSGATQMAEIVVSELTRIGSPLAAYLN